MRRTSQYELAAGDKASFQGGEIATGRMDTNEVERELSWREGYLEFHDTPLPEVVAEFNRYRTHKIEIDDSRINSIRIGGRFRCTDANSFLALLQQGFPVVVTSNENHVGLHRR
jgi:transmembrane sensor